MPAVDIEPIGFIWVTCRNGDHALWVSSYFVNLEVGKEYEVTARLLESSLVHGERAKRIVAPLVFEDQRSTYAYEFPRTERWTSFVNPT